MTQPPDTHPMREHITLLLARLAALRGHAEARRDSEGGANGVLNGRVLQLVCDAQREAGMIAILLAAAEDEGQQP